MRIIGALFCVFIGLLIAFLDRHPRDVQPAPGYCNDCINGKHGHWAICPDLNLREAMKTGCWFPDKKKGDP